MCFLTTTSAHLNSATSLKYKGLIYKDEYSTLFTMSDVIVTTKGKRVLEFLCSKTLIFQIPLYFKLGEAQVYVGARLFFHADSVYLRITALGIKRVSTLLKLSFPLPSLIQSHKATKRTCTKYDLCNSHVYVAKY